jgi:hypothetical protein
VNQCSHDIEVVVDTLQENALVAEWDTVVSESFKGNFDFRRQLSWMVGMNAYPERMEFLKHLAQFRRNTLGKENRDPGPDSKEFDMRYRSQTAQDSAKFVVRKKQGVAPGKKHISNLGVRLKIVIGLFEIDVKFLFADSAYDPAPSAVTAI